jgi:hypothetical protein
MKLKSSEQGAFNVLVIPLVLSTLFFFIALGFGLWAFAGRNDYKNNVDQKIATATKVAVDRANTAKDNEYLEKEKNPYRDYTGPDVLGSFSLKYPKTWSTYLSLEKGNTVMIFHPLVIPANDKTAAYALRVEVIDGPYDKEATKWDSDAKTGAVRITPYRLPKLPDVLGVRIDGQIVKDKKRGSIVLLPMRDKTMKISTESEDFVKDFNNIILPNFTFVP